MGLRQVYKTGILPPPKPSFISLFRLDAPSFSSLALNLYTQMYQALSRGDARSLEKVCSDEQLDKLRTRIKTRPKGQTIDWKMDEKDSKAEVLSVRCVDAWGTSQPEDHVAQILVRFDTRQSIAVYGPGGKLVSGDPAKTVRVREHFLLEKKNWQGYSDWMIRVQMPRSS